MGLAVHPILAEAARCARHAIGSRWQVDETYVKVAGCWRYVYRAVDEDGQVIDVYVSSRRDSGAARRFFDRALTTTVVAPVEVATDQAGATCDADARTVIAGHAFIQNIRRGNYELAADAPPKLQVAAAFDELVQAA